MFFCVIPCVFSGLEFENITLRALRFLSIIMYWQNEIFSNEVFRRQ